MRLHDALDTIQRMYIETAPFIYYTEQRAGYVEKMRVIFADVDQGKILVDTSVITLVETLMKPLREGDTSLADLYRQMLYRTQHVTLLPISASVAEQAADLRARYNLRTLDALHVATAIEAGCDAFVTNDVGIRRVTEIRVLVLDDLTTS